MQAEWKSSPAERIRTLLPGKVSPKRAFPVLDKKRCENNEIHTGNPWQAKTCRTKRLCVGKRAKDRLRSFPTIGGALSRVSKSGPPGFG
jgi:hypothetical protein